MKLKAQAHDDGCFNPWVSYHVNTEEKVRGIHIYLDLGCSVPLPALPHWRHRSPKKIGSDVSAWNPKLIPNSSHVLDLDELENLDSKNISSTITEFAGYKSMPFIGVSKGLELC